MSERPKVQHSKCCVVSQPPWVQIPALPPLTARPRWGRAVLLCCARVACVAPGWPGLRVSRRGPAVRETRTAPAEVVVGVCETWTAPAEVVVGVCETWTAPACSIAPEMVSFGEAGVVWVSWGCVGVIPGPPLPRLLWGWVKPGPPVPGVLNACVKPGPPLPVPLRLKWGVLVKQGWSGFQRVCGCDTWTTPAEVVVGVCETGAAPACSEVPEMGSFGEARVVWVSAGVCGVRSGGGLGFSGRVGVIPGPPVLVPSGLKWGVLAKQGWSGFHGGVWGAKQGWSGFQRWRRPRPLNLNCAPGPAPAPRGPWHWASPPCCADAKGAGPRRSRPFD